MSLRNDSNSLNSGNEDNWNSSAGDPALIFSSKINITFSKSEKVAGLLSAKFSAYSIFLTSVCLNFSEKSTFRHTVVVNSRGGSRKFMLITGKKGICLSMQF